jgi:CubicO group peptidase (beta-lactamase class C family)
VLTPELRARLAVGYSNGEGRVATEQAAREHEGRGYKVPNGGLYSTVGDLAKFLAALTDASPVWLLSDKARAELLRVQTPGDTKRGYGLGFNVALLPDGRTIASHDGGVAGYTANLAFDVQHKVGAIVLRNYERGRTDLEIIRGLVERLGPLFER